MSDLSRSFAGRWIAAIAANLRRIAVFCLVIAVASGVWALTREEMWDSAAVAMVPGSTSSLAGGLGGLGAIVGAGGLGDVTGLSDMLTGMGTPGGVDINLVMQVLSSRTVIERVILRHGLLDDLKVPTMDHALIKMGKRVSVTLSTEGFIVVSARADSRELAAAIVNDIIQFGNEELDSIITSQARRARIRTEAAVEEAADSLEAAQERLEEFRVGTGLIFPEQQGVEAVSMLSQLETQLLLSEAELAGVAATVASGAPAYMEISATVGFLREAIGSRMTEAGENALFPAVDSLPSLLREYEGLSMDLETRRVVYLLLLQELESLRVDEARQSPTVEVVVPAIPSALRAYPKRKNIVLRNTAIALLVALLWIAVLTFVRGLLRDEEQGPYWRKVLRTAGSQLYLVRRRRRGED